MEINIDQEATSANEELLISNERADELIQHVNNLLTEQKHFFDRKKSFLENEPSVCENIRDLVKHAENLNEAIYISCIYVEKCRAMNYGSFILP